MSLMTCLSTIHDPRRKEGLRTNLNQILSMVTISYLCGYFGYRQLGSFCKSYSKLFTEELDLKHPVPSHVTFRDVLMRISEQELIDAFNQWTENFVPITASDWISGDGKSLNSTVTNQANSNQDFQSVVSLFCQSSGLVAKIATFRNKKKSEIEVVIEVLKLLKINGLIIRLDALHTQKKQF